MRESVGHALTTYRQHKDTFETLQRNGMSQDLSWANAAQQYEDVLVAAKFQW
jgi:starch synthase